MKKFLSFLLCFLPLFGAQAPIYVAPPGNKYTVSLKEDKKSPKPKGLGTAEIAAMTQSKPQAKQGANDIMVISPESRAKDLQAAIQYLKKHAPASKPTVKLTDGSEISGIVDVAVMPGGTILIFKIGSLKGLQYKVVNIEQVQSISE